MQTYPELHTDILQPPEGVEIKVDKSGIAWYEPDGMYCSVSFKEPEEVSLEEMKANVEEWIKEKQGEKICWLTVVDGKQKSTKEVRDYLAEILPQTIKAMALVAPNVLARMASTVFFRLKKQDYPVEVFKDVESAKTWLRNHL